MNFLIKTKPNDQFFQQLDTYELFSLYILPLFKIILKTPLFRNINHKTYISKKRCFYKVITRFYFTFIFIVDFLLLPSVAMAVIFTVFFFPAFFVFTLPLDVTVAYFMLLDLQRSFLLAPLPALTLAFNFSVFPAGTRFFPLMMIFLLHLC